LFGSATSVVAWSEFIQNTAAVQKAFQTMIVNNATAECGDGIESHLASTTPEASDTPVPEASRLGGLLY
jgi:hypothetical protein